MTHRQAAKLVEQHGGIPVYHVTQQTTLLVIGEEGWPLEPDGQPSVKLLQAQTGQQKGLPIRILSESEWRQALGLEPLRPQQLFTPAMLCQQLGVSVYDIRRWERMGLIHAVRRVMRLPYFDCAEVNAARRLAELIAAGASAEHLSKSLQQLRSIVPDVDRPLAQLEMLARGSQLLYRDKASWIDTESGQRLFSFEADEPQTEAPETIPFPAPDDSVSNQASRGAEDWFHEGCRLSEESQLTAATEAFRLALIDRPAEPEYHFHLADTLYRLGNVRGAIERYYAAVEHDHQFLEAWTQLGCALAEIDDTVAARDAFQVALDLHPDFPDAHFHLAQLLERLGETFGAKHHWKTYLSFDQRGPWAELARQRLHETVPQDDQ